MPSYITLMNWTDQGVKSFKDSVDRADAAEVALSPAGIKFKGLLDGRSVRCGRDL